MVSIQNDTICMPPYEVLTMYKTLQLERLSDTDLYRLYALLCQGRDRLLSADVSEDASEETEQINQINENENRFHFQ